MPQIRQHFEVAIRHVRQRLRGRARIGAGHVRHAIMRHAFLDIHGIVDASSARDVSAQPPWSMAMSTSTLPGRIWRSISRLINLGAFAPGTSTAPINKSTVGSKSDQVRLARKQRVRRVQRDVQKTHPFQIHFQNRHVRAQARAPCARR